MGKSPRPVERQNVMALPGAHVTFGCGSISVSATGPDSNSSEPPLRILTRAVAVRVKAALPLSIEIACQFEILQGDRALRHWRPRAAAARHPAQSKIIGIVIRFLNFIIRSPCSLSGGACSCETLLFKGVAALRPPAMYFPVSRHALGLADHPFKLLRACVGAIDFGHAAQIASKPVGRDFARIRTGRQPLGKAAEVAASRIAGLAWSSVTAVPV
jgi:hypothetical protein